LIGIRCQEADKPLLRDVKFCEAKFSLYVFFKLSKLDLLHHKMLDLSDIDRKTACQVPQSRTQMKRIISLLHHLKSASML
jgi:hypothetical protein